MRIDRDSMPDYGVVAWHERLRSSHLKRLTITPERRDKPVDLQRLAVPRVRHPGHHNISTRHGPDQLLAESQSDGDRTSHRRASPRC